MKTHEFLTSFLLIIFLQSICSVCFAVDENHPGYHIIKGVPQTPGYNSEYIFKNTPDDIPFIITFSLNKLLNDPEIVEIEREAYVGQVVFSIRTNENIKVWLQYWIYTAVSDAEVALVERFCTSNLGRDNAIDI